MGCGGSKESKVVPEVIISSPAASSKSDFNSTHRISTPPTQLEIEQVTIEKSKDKPKAVLPPIVKTNIAFDIILDEQTDVSPIPIPKGASSRLTLPKITPKKSNEELAQEAEDLKERIAEREAAVAMNKEIETEKKLAKIAMNEEKKRRVLEKKRLNEELDSKDDIDADIDLEEEQ